MTVIGNLNRLGMLVLEPQLGVPTFRYLERDIPCIPSAVRRGTMLQIGGFEVAVAFSLLVRREHFYHVEKRLEKTDGGLATTYAQMQPPAVGKEIRYRDRDFRIISVNRSPAGEHYEIVLADPER